MMIRRVTAARQASNGPAVGKRQDEGLLGRPCPFAHREFRGAAALSEQEQRDTGGWHRPIFRAEMR